MQTSVEFDCQLQAGDRLVVEVLDGQLFIGTKLIPDAERIYDEQSDIRLNREQTALLVEFLGHQLTFEKFE